MVSGEQGGGWHVEGCEGHDRPTAADRRPEIISQSLVGVNTIFNAASKMNFDVLGLEKSTLSV